MNFSLAPALLLAFALTLCPQTRAQTAKESTAFQPPGMWCWDNWFAHDGKQWHAFYLQLPKAVGMDRRWKNNDFHKHVGHATSTDLRHWQDAGPALVALSGTWNNRHIATGSILRHDARWWMVFTGRGTQGDGVGLASSEDLFTWKTEPQPLFPLIDTFADKAEKPFESSWQGKPQRWAGISDPFLLPEAQEGWYYLVLCSRVLGVPLAESGCLTLLRSRDLWQWQWQEAGILAWPRCFERMETPQLWRHEDRWLLSFGGVLDKTWSTAHADTLPAAVRGKASHLNYCYSLPSLHEPAREENLRYVELPRGAYIMKVLKNSSGDDVALFTQRSPDREDSGISLPHPVTYGPDHMPVIHGPEAAER